VRWLLASFVGSAINKSFDLTMSLRMAFFEDLIHLSFGKHGIIVGHALSENTSQFRERERETRPGER
jgi:hypothetical protein